MSNLKWADVAHYYTDIPCLETITKREFQAAFFLPKTHRQFPFNAAWYGKEINFSNTYTPILRALEDMTEGEIFDLMAVQYPPSEDGRLAYKFCDGDSIVWPKDDVSFAEAYPRAAFGVKRKYHEWVLVLGYVSASSWSWLISKGFDVFGLIESEQAIRKEVPNV